MGAKPSLQTKILQSHLYESGKWFSAAVMAKDIGELRNSTSTALKALVDKGVLMVQHHNNAVNTYRKMQSHWVMVSPISRCNPNDLKRGYREYPPPIFR
jgi:hypothetical protein